MLLSKILLAAQAAKAWNPLAGLIQEPIDVTAGHHWENDSGFSGLEDYVVDERFSLLRLHRQLMEIPSISGKDNDIDKLTEALEENGFTVNNIKAVDNEHEVGVFLARYLKEAGLTVETQDLGSGRFNIYAYHGSQRDTSVVVTSHIDTVPPFIPYSVDGTKIRGRGACDDKGPLAAQVIAYLDLLHAGKIKEGEVSLLFVVGEENSGSGMRKASKDLGVSWDYAIFGEPTENKLGVGHKGIYVFDLEVIGKAAHSGYPQLGVSATEILVDLLYKIQNLDLPVSDLLGPSTVNIGRIDGGVAANVVAAHAKATVAIRVASELEEVVKQVHAVVDGVEHAAFTDERTTEPQYLDYKVPGFESIILAYNTDVPNLSKPLKKRFLYGPGTIHVAHGDDEHVENQDLLDAVKGYKDLVEHVLAL